MKPRARAGHASIAKAALAGHSAPMKMPRPARQTNRKVKFGAVDATAKSLRALLRLSRHLNASQTTRAAGCIVGPRTKSYGHCKLSTLSATVRDGRPIDHARRILDYARAHAHHAHPARPDHNSTLHPWPAQTEQERSSAARRLRGMSCPRRGEVISPPIGQMTLQMRPWEQDDDRRRQSLRHR